MQTTTCLTSSQRHGPPPYGQRAGWRPRAPEDFGDGGAFPEIPLAQYPLLMGKKGSGSSSNALTVQVDAEGKVNYDAIARQGHGQDRIIHTSFRDLIPLRQRAETGDISLARPSQEEVEETRQKTQAAIAKLVGAAVTSQKPKNIQVGRKEAQYVRYTGSSSQMGNHSKKQERIIKIVERQRDP